MASFYTFKSHLASSKAAELEWHNQHYVKSAYQTSLPADTQFRITRSKRMSSNRNAEDIDVNDELLKSDYYILEVQVEKEKRKVRGLQKRLLENDMTIRHLERENNKLTESVTDNGQNSSYENKNREPKKENDGLRLTIAGLNQTIRDLRSSTSKTNGQSPEPAKIDSRLNKVNTDLKALLAQRDESLKRKAREIEELHTKCKRRGVQIRKLQEDKQMVSQAIKSVKEHMAEADSMIEEHMKAINEAMASHEEDRNMIEDLVRDWRNK